MIVARNTRAGARAAKRAGFTLMEVLVVVAILVILASVAGFAAFRYFGESQEDAARLKITKLETAVNAYKLKRYNFPASLDSLAMPEDGKPAYLEEKDLFDPWGQKFEYDPNNLGTTGKPYIFTKNPANGEVIANR